MPIAALDRYALRMVYAPGNTRQYFLQRIFVKPSRTWPGCMIDTVNTRALTRPSRLEQSRAIRCGRFSADVAEPPAVRRTGSPARQEVQWTYRRSQRVQNGLTFPRDIRPCTRW